MFSTLPFGRRLSSDIWGDTPLEDFFAPSTMMQAPANNQLMSVDIVEGANDYTLLCDVPGVLEKDIDMSFDENFLTIRAKRHRANVGTIHRGEREYGNLQRRLRLPMNCNKDTAKATHSPNGVLKIVFQKTEGTSGIKKIQFS